MTEFAKLLRDSQFIEIDGRAWLLTPFRDWMASKMDQMAQEKPEEFEFPDNGFN